MICNIIYTINQYVFEYRKAIYCNLKFHAVLLTIFSQLTLKLNCYCLVPK